jgi:predicted nucleotidyltransferase
MKAAGQRAQFEELLRALNEACQEIYGERLVSVAVFGSVGRAAFRPDSDIDLLLVARSLPPGRLRRVEEFTAVEERLRDDLDQARESGVETRLSPVFKTPEEVRLGSPLFLDMTEDARILLDHKGFLAGELARLKKRLEELGARRVRRAGAWYWDLKPDYQEGDEFEL